MRCMRATSAPLAGSIGAGLGIPPEQMRIEKQREFGRLKFEYEKLRSSWGGYSGYFADPEATRASMCGEYFMTGDLGFLHRGDHDEARPI